MSETNGKLAGYEDFWKLIDREYTTVDVPKLGKVRLQNLSDGEQRALSGKAYDDQGQPVGVEYLFADRAIAQVVDEEGLPIFGEMHREKLMELPYYVTRPLMEAMVRHNQEGPAAPSHEDLKKK